MCGSGNYFKDLKAKITSNAELTVRNSAEPLLYLVRVVFLQGIAIFMLHITRHPAWLIVPINAVDLL